ncbi:MAG: L-threonylcarbamoyladenylate synthase [Thermoanaerobaculaceae bacterium]|jgi:L-threonylcarbamoyladenylate synthase
MLRLPFTLKEHLAAAAGAVRSAVAGHGVTAIPTETFYGLAVDPRDNEAVGRVFDLKGRPVEKALLVVGASLAQLERLVVVPPDWRSRLEAAWPAPVTVVLPACSRLAAGGAGRTLAVRVPSNDLLRALLEVVGPLTATSANRSGGAPLVSADDVADLLGHGLAVLLDGGDTPGGAPSSLLDLAVDPPRLVRAGPWEPPTAWGVKP